MFGRRKQPVGNATNAGSVTVPSLGNGTAAAAATNGKRRSGIFGRKRNSVNPVVSGTTTTGTVNYHVARDAALATGAVGLAEHHQHHVEREHEAGLGTKVGEGGVTGTGMTGTGGGAMGTSTVRTEPAMGAGIPASSAAGFGTSAADIPVQPTMANSRSLQTSGVLNDIFGTLLCSPRLMARGQAKKQQAEAIRMQVAELSEADRLEMEAKARRERAVAHGAHPAHGAVGGPAISTAGTTTTGTIVGGSPV